MNSIRMRLPTLKLRHPQFTFWNASDLEFLRRWYPVKGGMYVANHVQNHSYNSIVAKAKSLGMHYKEFEWSAEDAAFLRKWYPRMGTKYVAEKLHRKPTAVKRKAMAMNVRFYKSVGNARVRIVPEETTP